ncbi:MAG: hypothetical protein FJ278_17840, partial [Planctomycetes bacterium]|nr:hypothetical protein [Planctomycetota bacterium]
MKQHIMTAVLLVVSLSGAAMADGPQMLIGAPDTRPTLVDASGGLQQAWGTVSVSLVIEGGPSHTARTHQFYAGSASPTVVTETVAGPLTLAACAYRAPIWPEGVDVLEAIVRNNSADPRTARLVLRAPKELTFQGTSLRHGGRAVVALPPAQPILKNSGCLTDARALPRWGKPAAPCDPGFQHIRAGMGGIPITYRFA